MLEDKEYTTFTGFLPTESVGAYHFGEYKDGDKNISTIQIDTKYKPNILQRFIWKCAGFRWEKVCSPKN